MPHRQSPRDDRKKSDVKPISRPLRPYPGPTGGRRPKAAELEARDWEVIICGELVDKEGQPHDTLIELPRNSRGVIYFDSCGGSAYVGLALASLIRLRGLK